MNITVYNTPPEIADAAAYSLMTEIRKKVDLTEKFYLAVSGGSTPKILFERLSKQPFRQDILWQFLHIFWVDERCVPPGHEESNYGMTKKNLLDHVNIPAENIHRMKGEAEPRQEASRYAEEIKKHIPIKLGFPSFDWILLGMGSDGHTASLFPGKKLIMSAENICGTAVHPQSGQNRITLTDKVINNASAISFLVTGKDKAGILTRIIKKQSGYKSFPAAAVTPVFGTLEWLVDREAYPEGNHS
jgi:6-phosphogluconolactonase